MRRGGSQAGLTLIELAIVLLIVGLLAMVATPLTSSWTANADLHTAGGQLSQAYSHAKAVALRNEAGAIGSEPAARIDYDVANRELRVCRLPAGPCDDALWLSSLPAGVELSLAEASFPIELNNRGQPAAKVTANISKGGETDVYALQ